MNTQAGLTKDGELMARFSEAERHAALLANYGRVVAERDAAGVGDPEATNPATAADGGVTRNLSYSVLGALEVLLTPAVWIQNYEFNADLDRFITDCLDSGETFQPLNDYEATIGGVRLWVANHPYASFTVHQRRPSRITILRAGYSLRSSMLTDDDRVRSALKAASEQASK